MSQTYHHVLRRTRAREEGEPVYVRLKPDDEWQDPAPDRYRVVGCPIPLDGHFCFVATDGARMCTVGVTHQHTYEQQPRFGRGWSPSEIAP